MLLNEKLALASAEEVFERTNLPEVTPSCVVQHMRDEEMPVKAKLKHIKPEQCKNSINDYDKTHKLKKSQHTNVFCVSFEVPANGY